MKFATAMIASVAMADTICDKAVLLEPSASSSDHWCQQQCYALTYECETAAIDGKLHECLDELLHKLNCTLDHSIADTHDICDDIALMPNNEHNDFQVCTHYCPSAKAHCHGKIDNPRGYRLCVEDFMSAYSCYLPQ
eukprot:Trichotokara_eunicae@DN6318_c0_g1_i5.p1